MADCSGKKGGKKQLCELANQVAAFGSTVSTQNETIDGIKDTVVALWQGTPNPIVQTANKPPEEKGGSMWLLLLAAGVALFLIFKK